MREDLKTESEQLPHSSLQLSSSTAHCTLRTGPVDHSSSSRLSHPSPCTQPSSDTSTSDGMQSADNTMGGHKEIFRPMQLFEAGMVATDNSHHHSTNRTSFLELLQGVRITTTIQSPRTVTASPQSTISWS